MIITPQFVLLNFPKTGSTFVRAALREIAMSESPSVFHRMLYKIGIKQRPFQELMLPNVKVRQGYREHPRDQHGTYSHVPEQYRRLPVLTAIRNPFDLYVSLYEFRWWAEHPIDDPELIKKRFPDFPDLSFSAYLEYGDFMTQRYRIPHVKSEVHLGPQTVTFVQMYFKNPNEALSQINDEYIEAGAYRQAMPDMHILRTESLNQDLYDFLLEREYPKEEIAFILDREKIQPPRGTNRKAGQDWRDYYTPELVHRIYDRERILLQIYRDVGVGEPASWPLEQ